MSDVDHATREWRFYLRDMIRFGEKVLSYSAGIDQESFVADGRTYDAVLRNLKLIGEAATHIPIAVWEAHPEIPWNALIRTRDRPGPGYLSVRDSDTWSFIRTAIPPLLPALHSLLTATDKDQT